MAIQFSRKLCWTEQDVAHPSFVMMPHPQNATKLNPISVRCEAWGCMRNPTQFYKTQDNNEGKYVKFPGGTVSGGIVFLPPEVDIFCLDWDFDPPGVIKSNTYIGVSGGAAFFAGIPTTLTGGVRNGYSWKADAFSDLIFSRHSAMSNKYDAVRFTSVGRLGFKTFAASGWGDFHHSNSVDRQYDMPDESGVALISGSGLLNWQTGFVLHGKVQMNPGVVLVPVAFWRPFLTAPPTVLGTLEQVGGAPAQAFDIDTVTVNGFNARRGAGAGTAFFHWFAIGF